MQRDRFDKLVQRLEHRFARRPGDLQLRILAWLLFGYAVFLIWLLLAILAGVLAFVAGAVLDISAGFWLLLIGGGLATLATIQTFILLSMKLEPPTGLVVTRKDVPELFAVLGDLQSAMHSRVDCVLLVAELNAGIIQIPRLGVFGWTRRYLRIGVPLMALLTPDEFRAVLAHELAHLSAEHGRFGNWLYRLRITWEKLFMQFHTDQPSGIGRMLFNVVNWFVDWYWPRFNARAFVLGRAYEYFADQTAARLAGAENVASSLWRIGCGGQRLGEKIWVDVWLAAKTQAQPPDDVVAQLNRALATMPDPVDAARWSEHVAHELTDYVDTHPCFADRVAALGLTAETYRAAGFPRSVNHSAADEYLGAARVKLEEELSGRWKEDIKRNWSARHAQVEHYQRQINIIDQGATAEVGATVLWDKIRLILDVDGAAPAESLLQQLLQIEPTHGGANLALGQHWLESGRIEGAELLQRVLDGDEFDWIPLAGQMLGDHFRKTGETDRWQQVRSKLDRFEQACAASRKERSTVSKSDRLLPHELEPAELQQLTETLIKQTDLQSAWLVRKELKHFPRRRLFILCVQSKRGWLGSSAEKDQRLVNQLTSLVRLPGQRFVIAPQGGFKSLALKVMHSPESAIYPIE